MKTLLRSAIAFAALTLSHPAAAAQYLVDHVAIDPAWNANQAPMKTDDPRLLGRVVQIGPHTLTTDATASACTAAGAARKITLGAWLSDTFATSGGRQPGEFGLDAYAHSLVDSRDYRCDTSDPSFGKATTAALSAGRVMLAWKNQEVLLMLRPVDATDRPHPAFACKDAYLPAEKTICSSLSLANWDRSVAAEYARVRSIAASTANGKPQGDLDGLRAEQTAWLKRRDSCGEHADCLLKAYRDRMQALADDAINGGAVASADDKAAANLDMQWYAQHLKGH